MQFNDQRYIFSHWKWSWMDMKFVLAFTIPPPRLHVQVPLIRRCKSPSGCHERGAPAQWGSCGQDVAVRPGVSSVRFSFLCPNHFNMEALAWALAAKPPPWASLRQHCKESSCVDLHPSAPFRSLGSTTINIKDLLYESGAEFGELGSGGD